ncbi:flagellar hook-length control protein FliK [Aeromonas finlandensis]|uniref:flagellar hook-length control protein FliK n=1 Tax=Aeromonas finlandensis TaxID=1543375 RepID=UPI00051AC8EF|nr:flagellar hook-length control protein FliK [Aeromonas finlandensis]
MMQTLLTQTPSAPANGLDKAPLSGSSENKGIDSGTGADNKGDFASLIAKVQGGDKKGQSSDKGAADATNNGQSARPAGTAKSLANENNSDAIKEKEPDSAQKSDDELPVNDFLLHLQDSLKLDTSLVTTQAAAALQQSAASGAQVDGNLLPQQEGEQEDAQPGDSEISPSAGKLAQPLAGKVATESSSSLMGMGTAQGKPDTQLSEQLSTGEVSEASDAITSAKGSAQQPDEASAKGEKLPLKEDAHAAVASGKGEKQLSVAERLAQLAKVLPVDESAGATKPGELLTSKEGGDGKSDTSATPNHAMTGKGQAAQAANQGVAIKAFSDGLKQPDNGAATAPATAANMAATNSAGNGDGKGADKSAAEGSPSVTSTSTNQNAAVSAQGGAAQSSAAQSAVTQSAMTQSDGSATPVMVAPEQVLAQAESQGPQAPLSTISAGIQQMEVSGSSELRKAVQLDAKQKVGEPDKSTLATASASESSQSQTVQHSQNSQPQPQLAENRAPSAAEGAVRREPQNLPHLKLASQEAPAELHQKVNVMLAEKLQQAEIQLDPLGLGKMKIQIQIGADSQANVHFVVQHGQTREMLEQAMPRLRDMLAGQGIQLGQTQVQQQSQQQQQQQQQGQAASSGQGQQAAGGSQSHTGNGQVEGEFTTSTLSLLVESTNGSGIDFYA